MTYRVAFSKRFQSDGNESVLDPTADLDVYLPDGVVAEKVFVERFEPEAKHSQEVLDEDDAFLGLSAAEVWEYEVLNDRAEEFEDAIRNSGTVMEFNIIDESITDRGELSRDTPLADGDSRMPTMSEDLGGDATEVGSGVRAGDDGPAGQPTGDPSAGGMSSDRSFASLSEGLSGDSGGLDDLSIVSEDDPSLGLTNFGEEGPDDWAADQGPSRNPDRGIIAVDSEDDQSTLAPERIKR